MIRRSYFFKVEVKPNLVDKYLQNNDYVIITGTFDMITILDKSQRLYANLLDSIQDAVPFEINTKDWITTGFNRIN